MRGDPISIHAKITRPLCRDIFPRSRLFTLLDTLSDKPALWISGPPGSGKTALVSSYLEQENSTCIWYQMDTEDNDPATFFYYLAKGAEQTVGHTLAVPPFTAEYFENPLSFTRWFFELLLAGLAGPVVFVFDNYQELPTDSVIHTIIDTMIGTFPPGSRLMIISRDTMPNRLTRRKLNGRIGSLSWKDLRLTREESAGILTRSAPVPEDRITLLHEKACGWVAGLLLLANELEITGSADMKITDLSNEDVFGYFAAEIFERLDTITRDFLLRTSVLPHMTIGMAKKLSGVKNGAEILLALNKRNYFVSKRPGIKCNYQYHPLFREFLLTLAQKNLPEGDLKNLREKAGLLLQDCGEIEEAANLFIAAQCWPRLIGLVLEHAGRLCGEGRIRPLMEWIKTIPEEIRTGSPWLLYWLGTCRIYLDPVNSMPLLEKAYDLFSRQHDIAGMLLTWASIVNSILFRSGSFTPFQQWIDAFAELEQYLDDQPLQVKAPVIVSMLYALGLASTDRQLFDKWAEKGNHLIQQDIDVINKAHTFNLLIVKTTFRGDLAGAAYYLRLFRSFDSSTGLPPFPRIQLKNCAATLAWLSGRFDECEQEGHAGLQIAETSGVHLYNHYFYGQLAAGALSTGNVDSAEKYLQEMAGCMNRMRPWEQSFFHVFSTWSACLAENVSLALLHAQTGVTLISTMGTEVNNGLIYLGMALAQNLAEQHEKADNYLQLSLKVAVRAGDRQTEFTCLLAGAWLSLQQDNHQDADNYLRRALSIGRAKGYVNGYFWNSEVMGQLCHHALSTGIEEEYVQGLIQTRAILPPPRAITLENWPWKIKIFTLGRFSLLIDNNPVAFSGKAQARPLELLSALLALGGRGVSKEKVADILWPDSLGDAAISSLSTTMQRLRKILTVPEAIIVQQGSITLNPRLCWVDTWAFERFLSAAADVAPKHIENRFTLLQRAGALYHGPFLQELGDSFWLNPIRERLQKKFSRISLPTADILIQKKNYQ